MATLYLVRHGQAAAGVEDLDPGLDDIGRLQAQAAADALASTSATRLAVSPLRRTRETAEPIARALGLEPAVREEVAEVFDPTMPIDDRRNMIGPFMASRWSEQPEHLHAWRARVVATLRELAGAGDTVVVSHYVAISVAVGEALHDDRVIPEPVANASITELRVDADAFEIIRLAATDHLGEDLVTGLRSGMQGRPAS